MKAARAALSTATATAIGALGLGALALAPALAGCSRGAREATAVSDAVRRFHEADNQAKPAAADVVAKVACTEPEVCAARDACARAAGDWGAALRLMAEAQAGLSDLKAGKLSPGDPVAKGLSAKLDGAQAKLSAGHDAMPACDALVQGLKVEYGL